MRRCAVAALCFASLIASSARGQKTTLQPIHVAAGTVLVFHIQTRLHASRGDEADTLPKGTVILVKLLAPIDSSLDHDGAEFSGYVVSPITSGNEVVVHAHSEVRGILALLRSRAHPEGFRYDLLITSLTDQGKSYDLSASLNSSVFDGATASGTQKAESPGGSASATRN
jgi:hypothetical protein